MLQTTQDPLVSCHHKGFVALRNGISNTYHRRLGIIDQHPATCRPFSDVFECVLRLRGMSFFILFPTSRSSMPTLKRNNPRTDPWRAPALATFGSDYFSCTLTTIFLPCRKLAIIRINSEGSPSRVRDMRHGWCSRRMNAFEYSNAVRVTAA